MKTSTFQRSGTFLLKNTFAVLSALALTHAAFPQTNCAPVPPGLVGWWPGESGPIAVDPVGGNHACLQDGVGFVAGKVGQAFQFDGSGSSFIALPNSPVLQPASNQLTIDAWIRPDFTVANGFDTILTKRDGCSGSGIGYFLGVAKGGSGYSPGTVFFSMSTASGGTVIPSGNTVVPNDGQFHHVAGTFDGLIMSVYLDGQLIGQALRDEPILRTKSAPVISHHGGLCPQRAVAAIDEIEFYNRALTSNEVAAIYNAGSNGLCHITSAEPRLQVARCQTTGVILWPVAAAGYALEENGDLSMTNGWNGVTNLPVPVSLLKAVVVDFTQRSRFYRLRK